MNYKRSSCQLGLNALEPILQLTNHNGFLKVVSELVRIGHMSEVRKFAPGSYYEKHLIPVADSVKDFTLPAYRNFLYTIALTHDWSENVRRNHPNYEDPHQNSPLGNIYGQTGFDIARFSRYLDGKVLENHLVELGLILDETSKDEKYKLKMLALMGNYGLPKIYGGEANPLTPIITSAVKYSDFNNNADFCLMRPDEEHLAERYETGLAKKDVKKYAKDFGLEGELKFQEYLGVMNWLFHTFKSRNAQRILEFGDQFYNLVNQSPVSEQIFDIDAFTDFHHKTQGLAEKSTDFYKSNPDFTSIQATKKEYF